MPACTHEIKTQLAKLLATEDLVVEHKKVDTACFNVHTRVLTLPTWNKASGNVYDLLVAHEVGHALFTPDCDWIAERKISPRFVNIVEDVRIEKLMKRKYPGLPKTFYNGYLELNDKDFFDLKNLDISSLNLADRANLFFKIGKLCPFSFKGEEQTIIDMLAATETFDEVLDAAEVLYNYCKKENEKIKIPNIDNLETSNEMGGDGNTPMDSDFSEKNDDEGQKKETEKSFSDSVSSSISSDPLKISDDEIDIQTDKSLSQNLQELSEYQEYESIYLEVPSVNINTIVISNKNLHDCCDKHYTNIINISDLPSLYDQEDLKFNSFKISAQKEVNYLVKEFECKKSASQYARSSVSRTGILDTTKLHTYKFNEDLFKKVSVIPDGKNHGLIFVCDWSGSMNNVLLDTIKQMFHLIWFCKKVQIPFDVYAFTTQWWSTIHEDENGCPLFPTDHCNKRENLFAIHPNFNMLNILTSSVSNTELDRQMKNIWRVGEYYSKQYTRTSIPSVLELSSTPLNEAIISLFEIIPDFKKRSNAEKVNVVVFTDGESNAIHRYREISNDFNENKPSFRIGMGYIPHGAYVRDRKTGNTYSISKSNDQENIAVTVTLLRNLSDRFPQENIIGIRVCESRDFSNHLRRYIGYWNNQLVETYTKQWKKERAVSLPNSGYKKYFTFSATSLSQDSEFVVDDDATKSQIKSAFVKSLNAKKTNKKILNEFIDLVA
jgi:hypothetical protein